MTLADLIIGLFTGETPEQIEASFQQTRNDFFGEYNQAELRQMELEETQNYVEASDAMRRVSYNEVDTVMYWEEYVIDQKGRKHIIAAGETPIMPAEPLEMVYGEVMEEFWVYLELEGGM